MYSREGVRVMVSTQLLPRVRYTVLLVPLVAALAGCDLSVGNLTERATEEWTRSYPLAAGGEIRIGNTNGRVEVEGVDGSTVEIKAEKIARSATETGARELLPRITIRETMQSHRVLGETQNMKGLLF